MEDSPQPEKVRIRRLLWLPFLIFHTEVIGSQILTYRELDLVPQEAKKWTLQDQKGKFRLADFAVGETVSHWGRIAGDEYSVEFVHLFHSPARGGVFIYVLTRGALAAERAK